MDSMGFVPTASSFVLVLCDLGGVAVECGADQLVQGMSASLQRSFEEVQAIVYRNDLLIPFELGEMTPQRYYEGLRDELKFSWSYEQFVSAWNSILRENAGVIRLLNQLHSRYRIAALSNTNVLHLEYISAMPSLAVMDDWVASCKVGLRKPDPKIYHLALARLGVEPRQALYIDDRPEFVEAARQVGLTSIQCADARQLEQSLREVGAFC